MIDEIEGASTAEEASDTVVQIWFECRLTADPKDTAENGRKAIDSVKYKQWPQALTGAVMEFVLKIGSALDRPNSSETIQDPNRAKNITTKPSAKVNPPEFKF